jgi:hypothetical protein
MKQLFYIALIIILFHGCKKDPEPVYPDPVDNDTSLSDEELLDLVQERNLPVFLGRGRTGIRYGPRTVPYRRKL